MTDQLISFETAKLAKEKGFDIISRFGQDASLYNKKGIHVYYANYGFQYSGLNEGYISAPTQSLLQKWLREKHNIDIIIEPNIIDDTKYYCWRGRHNMNPATIGHIAETYEEALEQGLIEALELIS